MSTDAALVVSRFVHLLAVSVLFGAALFPSYALAKSQLEGKHLAWLRPVLFAGVLLSIASGAIWFLLLDDGASGRFGWVWPSRLLLGIALLLTLRARSVGRPKFVLVGSFLLLASIALTGNAGSNEGPTGFQHRLVDALHLVASGVWIGALAIFALLAIRSAIKTDDDDLRLFHHSLSRFSEVGTVAVAFLTFSGMLNPAFFLSSLRTTYGQVLLIKIVIFAMMLGLAALNRFWLTPRLSRAVSAAQTATAARSLRVSIVLEGALAVLVFGLIGWLGTLEPPTEVSGPLTAGDKFALPRGLTWIKALR